MEAILEHLTNKNELPPGLEAAKDGVLACVEAFVDAQQDQDEKDNSATDSALRALIEAREALQVERGNRGGHRVRQVLQLAHHDSAHFYDLQRTGIRLLEKSTAHPSTELEALRRALILSGYGEAADIGSKDSR